ncbi:MAG TPA: hypothetical protein PK668_06355 [Myxococcota bacterium]|nr:hypothetical protein [Myxococcota bacterium]HRY92536.1 hypothetical protein [Myxococcota bacterium]HSA22058.1 hypothetical protein [Myxococcota bacterium]
MSLPRSGRWLVLAALAGLLPACSGGSSGGSCVEPLFTCLAASGDCLVATDGQTNAVTLTWDSGARLEGSVGLASFQAYGPGGELCFERQVSGALIALVADGQTYQVERLPSGGVIVTCPDGRSEEHAPGSSVAGQPGIDPARLTGCRVQGMCSQDADCGQGDRCCQGTCHTGALCPGECAADADCGEGNLCCDGRCFSTPICNLPCYVDADCEDGVYCNGLGRCEAFRCALPVPIDCDDRVACTQDACDEAGRACAHTAQDALCGADEVCFPEEGGCQAVVRCSGTADCANPDVCLSPACEEGICRFTPVPGCCNQDADCADGLPCNGDERCQVADHTCLAGQPPDCADAVPCTQDACDDLQAGCVHLPDNDLCTAPQICDRVEGCMDAPACVEDQYEENDTADTATPLPNEAPVMPTLCPGDMADWFTITGEADQDVTIVVTWLPDLPAPLLTVESTPDWPVVEPPEAQGENMHVFLAEVGGLAVDFHLKVVSIHAGSYAYIVIGAAE